MRSKFVSALLIIAATGCASGGGGGGGGSGVAFGPQAATTQPVITSFNAQDIALAAPAHVVIIAVMAPQLDDGRPLLFQVDYPRFDGDPLEFQPGTYRVNSRQRTAAAPPRCQPGQSPTFQTCRPMLTTYPGVGGIPSLGQFYSTAGYIMVTNNAFMDPYTLADQLFNRARSRPGFYSAIKSNNAVGVQAELEPVLGTLGANWSAYYRPAR